VELFRRLDRDLWETSRLNPQLGEEDESPYLVMEHLNANHQRN